MTEEVSADKRPLDLSGEMPLVEGVETDEEILLSRDLTVPSLKRSRPFDSIRLTTPPSKASGTNFSKNFNFS
jgi:hypothetical protein